MWDVFISHASEDKPFVRELAQALEKEGLEVWYDEMTLTLGDSLRRSIDKGLAESRYGVVVLSPAFFAKPWTQYELDGLVTREMKSSKTILPVWHEITDKDIARRSPALADKVAVSTSEGLSTVVREILRVVRPTAKGFVVPSSYEQVGKVDMSKDLSTLPRLRQLLAHHFDASELHTLCFDLGVDYDDLRGEGKSDKARELVAYLDRRGRLSELVALARRLRPNVAW